MSMFLCAGRSPGQPGRWLAWSYLFLGNLFYTESDYLQALEQFAKAQQLAPNLAIAHVCMANAYHGLDDMASADKYYKRAVQVDPDDPNARKNLYRWRAIKEGLTGS